MSRSTILHVTPVVAVFVAFFVAIALLLASADSANAVATPVGLGSASSCAVLGGQTLTLDLYETGGVLQITGALTSMAAAIRARSAAQWWPSRRLPAPMEHSRAPA